MPEEYRVIATTVHQNWGARCKHVQERNARTIAEAIDLADNWPLSKDYELIEARVEARTVPEWREVYRHGPA